MTLQYLYAKFFKKILRGKCLKNCVLGKGVVIYSGSNMVNSTIGNYSYCGYDCLICNTEIGAYCSIADNVCIGVAEHPLEWISTSPVFQKVKHSGPAKRYAEFDLPKSKRTRIGNDVWIGHHAAIKQGVCIGDGAVIGTGAVVTKDVPPYAIVGGVPAKLIKYRFSEDIIEDFLKIKWWNLPEEILQKVAAYIKEPEKFISEIRKTNPRGGVNR